MTLPGLSPRVRGNRHFDQSPHDLVGSIPACAGEPTKPRCRVRYLKVYPRVCGGTAFTAKTCLTGIGLSPRVRGNQSFDSHLDEVDRSIPACAGEPGLPQIPTIGQSVYPRVCGGTTTFAGVYVPSEGLSPRVRGNHRRVGMLPDCCGSIPACAGEPCEPAAVS